MVLAEILAIAATELLALTLGVGAVAPVAAFSGRVLCPIVLSLDCFVCHFFSSGHYLNAAIDKIHKLYEWGMGVRLVGEQGGVNETFSNG